MTWCLRKNYLVSILMTTLISLDNATYNDLTLAHDVYLYDALKDFTYIMACKLRMACKVCSLIV